MARHYCIRQWTPLCITGIQRFAEIEVCSTYYLFPHYQQANGLAEKYVQVVKNLFKKATEEGKSPFDALNIYRNTPLAKNKLSPMQILSGRCPQNDLPMSDSARLKYGRPISIPTDILRDPKKESQANSHNFHLHQHVMFLQPDQKKWYPARVIELCKEPRSYIIQTLDNANYRCTEQHIKAYNPNREQFKMEEKNVQSNLSSLPTLQESRPKRNIKPLTRLDM